MKPKNGRVVTVTLFQQDDNYGPDDPRLFCTDDPDMDVTVTLPAHVWRGMGAPVWITAQASVYEPGETDGSSGGDASASSEGVSKEVWDDAH